MNELTCAEVQKMLLNTSINGGNVALDVLEHLHRCTECSDYAKICGLFASKEPPAELEKRTLTHCHTLLETTRKRRKNARIRTWTLCAGIAAVFAILLSLAVLDMHEQQSKETFAMFDEHFDGFLDETELSLDAEETASINLELDIFASEIY